MQSVAKDCAICYKAFDPKRPEDDMCRYCAEESQRDLPGLAVMNGEWNDGRSYEGYDDE